MLRELAKCNQVYTARRSDDLHNYCNMLSYAPKREKRWKAAQEVAVASASSAAPVPDAQEKLRGLVGLFDLDDADASDVRDELAAQFEFTGTTEEAVAHARTLLRKPQRSAGPAAPACYTPELAPKQNDTRFESVFLCLGHVVPRLSTLRDFVLSERSKPVPVSVHELCDKINENGVRQTLLPAVEKWAHLHTFLQRCSDPSPSSGFDCSGNFSWR